MNRTSDPYDVMDLPRSATLAQVRAKYYELARLHHPDKMPNASDQERAEHEEIFKRITCAYSSIEREKTLTDSNTHTNNAGSSFDFNADVDVDDWRSVWNHIEHICKSPGVWDAMKGIVKDTIKDVAVKGLEKLSNTHHVTLEVTMEEVHVKKQKKVRLFLNNMKDRDPLYVVVDIGEYPYTEIKHALDSRRNITICVDMKLKKHPIYNFDDILDSWDVFARVQITWVDYIMGKRFTLPYLDGTTVDIDVQPFDDYGLPIEFAGMGLCGLGNMYVSVELNSPKCKNEMSEADRDILISSLKQLY